MSNFPMLGSSCVIFGDVENEPSRQQAKMLKLSWQVLICVCVWEFFFLSFFFSCHCVLEKSHTFSIKVLIFAIEFHVSYSKFVSASTKSKSMEKHANKVIAISTESQIIFRTELRIYIFIWTKLLTQFPKMLPKQFHLNFVRHKIHRKFSPIFFAYLHVN